MYFAFISSSNRRSVSNVVLCNLYWLSRTSDLTRKRLLVWIPLTSRVRGSLSLSLSFSLSLSKIVDRRPIIGVTDPGFESGWPLQIHKTLAPETTSNVIYLFLSLKVPQKSSRRFLLGCFAAERQRSQNINLSSATIPQPTHLMSFIFFYLWTALPPPPLQKTNNVFCIYQFQQSA